MLDGKEVKTTWGKGQNFSVKDFKDLPFSVNKADKRQKDAAQQRTGQLRAAGDRGDADD